jgi:PST family polysaccharide transporter
MSHSPGDPAGSFDPPATASDIGRRSVQAGAFALIGQFLQFGFMLGAAIVLARLLTPADFGLVAMGMTIIEFTNLILDLGLPSSVQYQKQITKAQIDTLFWINFGFSVILAMAVVALGPAVARMYNEPLLIGLLPVLACTLIFFGPSIQHEAVLKRQLRFGTIAAASTAGTLAGVVASIALALGGAGYWALAAHMPVETLVRSTWLYVAGGWHPGRPRFGTGLWPTVRYGGDVIGNRLVNYFGKGLDRILISVFAGASSVGLYSLADRWAYGSQQIIYGRLLGVALSGFSRVRDDVERYRNYYRRAMRLLWTFMLPILAGVALEAEAVMAVLAGDQWDRAVPILRWLSLAALALSINHTTKWTLLAEGRTRIQLVWGSIQAVITAICIAIGATYGVTEVAMAYALATVSLTPMTFAVWLHGSPIRWKDVGSALARPAVAVAAMTLVWAIMPASDREGWRRLAVAVAILAPIYVAAWVSLPGRGAALRELSDVRAALRRRDTSGAS